MSMSFEKSIGQSRMGVEGKKQLTSSDNNKNTNLVIRKHFPETWLWVSSDAGYFYKFLNSLFS